jgi:hypothetical protein
MWKTSALVRLSGVQWGYTYAKCRRDLEALHAHGLIERLDRNGPWYLKEQATATTDLPNGSTLGA